MDTERPGHTRALENVQNAGVTDHTGFFSLKMQQREQEIVAGDYAVKQVNFGEGEGWGAS